MSDQVRLVIDLVAKPSRADEVATLLADRCQQVISEPGCLQFEIFRSVTQVNHFTLLELWQDQSALDLHAEMNQQREAIAGDMFETLSQREDYVYNRTR